MSTTTGFDLAELTALVNEQEFGLDFYQQAVMDNDTFAGARLNGQVLTGAKNDKYKLPIMEGTATLKDGSECGFTPTDQTTFDQTDLNMQAITIQGQFCVRELEPFWLASGLPAGQHYQSLGVLEANILDETARQIADKMALFPWYGPTGSDTVTYADSWIEQLQGGTGISLGTGPVTDGGVNGTDAAGAYNVVEAIKAVFRNNRHTAKEIFNGNIAIEMSPAAADLYWINYRKLFGDNTIIPAFQQLADGNGLAGWTHPGTRIQITIQGALGLSGHIVGFRRRNKVLAFDLESDATRLELGMDQYREYIWWKQRVKMGTAWRQITNPATATPNVVYYGPAS